MFEKDTMYLMVYKNKNEQKWLIFDVDNPNSSSDSDFGMIVLHVLNRIHKINSDGLCELKEFDGEKVFEKLPENHKDEWEHHFEELLNIIKNKDEYSAKELYEYYLKYRLFGYAIINNLSLKKCWDYQHFNVCEYVKYGGISILNGEIYDRFTVAGFETLFLLDLEELLFTHDLKLRIRTCQNCKNFYRTGRGNAKFCVCCREPKVYNKYRNQQQNNDKIKSLKKKIYNRLFQRNTTKASEFLGEYDYYISVLKGEPQYKLDSYTANVETMEDIYQWLIEKDKSTLLR